VIHIQKTKICIFEINNEEVSRMKTLTDQSPNFPCDELEMYIQYCRPVLNLLEDNFFVFLTTEHQIKWLSPTMNSYYHLNINDILGKNFPEIQNISASFSIIQKNLMALNNVTLPRIYFETNEMNHGGASVQWSISYLENQIGLPIGIVLFGKVHVEEVNQEKLHYLKNCLDTIIDNVPGSIYWKNKEGLYLGCNNAFVRKAKLVSKYDVIGKTDNELWPDYADELCERDREVMTLNKTIESEETVKINDTEVFYFLSIKTPLIGSNDTVIGVVGNSLDVSEIVLAKKKAQEANKIKSEFLLNMQHDIKTPISHIMGFTDILRNSKEIPKKFKEYLGYIYVSSKSLMELMTDILHFSDMESEEMPKRDWKFDLKEIIEKTVALNKIAVQQKGLEVLIKYDDSISYNLIGDRNRLQRIFLNLFSNAIKFTNKGSVEITTRVVKMLTDSRIILELNIEDTGIGIAQDQFEVIFDRFTRLSPSSCNQYPGSGLGLWIVKKFIEEIDGEIYVTSKVGVGSKFSCVFPCKTMLLDDYSNKEKVV
jgi:two-component system aerobic respiration control sensor histidine kinase ArcB